MVRRRRSCGGALERLRGSGLAGRCAAETVRRKGRAAALAARLLDAGSPEDCMRLLGDALEQAFLPASIEIFLAAPGGWCPVWVRGPVDREASARIEALAALAGPGEWVDLRRAVRGRGCTRREDARASLRSAGVALATRFASGSEVVGVLLLGGPCHRRRYTRSDRRFARLAVLQTSLAVENARLRRELGAARRPDTVLRLDQELAHDLAKPLGVLERLAGRLPKRLAESLQAARDAEAIASLSAELRAILDSLHHPVPRAEGQAARGPLTLAEVVRRAVTRVAPRSEEERIAVRMAPGVAETRAGDETLVRALANLLDNALEAAGRGGRVELSATAARGELQVDVVDRGGGMAPDVLARAFEPFFTTRAERGGRGIGLAIARGIVEAHGGRIALTSEPGRGTRVSVWLPAAPAAARLCVTDRRSGDAPREGSGPPPSASGA